MSIFYYGTRCTYRQNERTSEPEDECTSESEVFFTYQQYGYDDQDEEEIVIFGRCLRHSDIENLTRVNTGIRRLSFEEVQCLLVHYS